MKIVVLDGQAVNPGDLSWEPLSELGQLQIYERTLSPQEVMARAGQAEVILTNKVPLPQELLGELNRLTYIGIIATGYNNVDTVAARAQGITVTNVPGYGAPSVAQHVCAFLLEWSNQIGMHAASTARGEWAQKGSWCYTLKPMIEWEGKTLGIVGLGNIGTRVARIGQALGMRILAHGPRPREVAGVKWVSRDDLFRESDVVTLHCPLTADTYQMVNAEVCRVMKDSAFLINTGRGDLIQESDLRNALLDGEIAGAGLDVLSQEPPPNDHPLLGLPNCWVTPHHAWATRASRQRLLDGVIQNLTSYLSGQPIHVVNA